MDDTPNLVLPYIMAAQSQKHVTHNEALRVLDAIVQLSVLDRDLTAPPGSPADGDRYIVAAGATGAWAGHDGEIAAFQDGAWLFYLPREGWICWIADIDSAVVWDGTAWAAFGGGGGGGVSDHGALTGLGDDDHPQYHTDARGDARYTPINPTTLGVNATADTTNRLTVSAAATLLNHSGSDHRIKINKAAAANVASLLYQDNFSGRAEIGLVGDDDFHFKVSADGATFKEAMIIDRTTGAVSHLAGARHTFSHDATNAGLRLVPAAGDPSAPQDGDLWYNTTTGKFRKREGGATSDLDTTGGGGGFVPFASRCSAKVTSAVSVPTGVLTDIPLHTESYDIGGWHDTTTNPQRMTVPSGVSLALLWGYLQFTATLSGNYYMELYHFNSSGTQVSGPYPFALPLSAVGGAATPGPIAVSAGDYFILRMYHTSGAARSLWTDGRCYLAIAAVA
ncbi:MAG: DUF2793 domain-containing protein [Pseudomonadota bacterium]